MGEELGDRNSGGTFRNMHYTALAEIHKEFGERNVEMVRPESGSEVTLKTIFTILKQRNVLEQ